MALVPKIDPNKIFASNAPSQDKPAAFDNYEKGMDETRKNLGRPTIPQLNYLHQTADQKILWIHQNGGSLPYDPLIEYAANAVTLKDGELQKKQGAGWVIPYLGKSNNLDDVPNKATARNNLEVMSATEVDTAISNAIPPTTPDATETVAGKAKIATTAIAQAGINDTDIITAKKLRDVLGNSVKPRSWSNVTASRIAGTWYSNTTGNDIGVFISRGGANISASITVRKTGTSTELTLAGTGVGNNLVVSSTGFWEVPDGFDYKISPFNTVMELRV